MARLVRGRSTVTAEPFLNGTSSSYIEAMYEEWAKDPSSVHKVRVVVGLEYIAS